MSQQLIIPDWLPPQVANGSHGHWAPRRKLHQQTKLVCWAMAKQANWRRVSSRARLTITLVFPQQRRRDRDNLYARCKGIVDGLKPFFVDDSLDWLDLVVSAEVKPSTKQTRLLLEPLPSTTEDTTTT